MLKHRAGWIVLTLLAAHGLASADPTRVRVLLADADNLQQMSFWVARGAGYFADEGLDLQLVIAKRPNEVKDMFVSGAADVAVLQPPVYMALVADKHPLTIVANLLENDPINLIVRRSVVEARGISLTAPVVDRLRGLHGITIGIAPGPISRLRALYRSQGLDADQELQIQQVGGPNQNAWYADGKVDALYAHTPFLERALLDQDAVLVVNQSAGEVPALSGRMIHALVVPAAFAAAHPATVVALARAIYRAQRLVHHDQAAATDAILAALPGRDRRQVARIVALYAPALPQTPRVSVATLPSADLMPANRTPLDLTGIDLAVYVDSRFADQAVREVDSAPGAAPRWPWWLAIAAFAIIVPVALRSPRARKPPQGVGIQ